MGDLSAQQAAPIAIIGMTGRFPGAKSLPQFWQNLRDGVESITFFSDEQLEAEGIDPDLLHNPRYVKAQAVLDDIELFDAGFFGINPREAEIMDPQHRLFLEDAWTVLEDAGYNPETYDGLIGVFASTLPSNYMLNNLYPHQDLLRSAGGLAMRIANDRDFLPTRVSYKLNLKGPSFCVQTACSSSLVACHLACQSLLDYQCDIALVGGVAISLPQRAGYIYHEGGIYPPDGHCRAFDAKAQGTVAGNGIGIVALKRLEDAQEDGDHIYAVILGSAINNDGASKVGYTAPSVEGQAEVIALAHAVANIDPETIGYIEAHGTGTLLGDPIEIAALTQIFREQTDKTGFCAIGSVKTNIGHLDPAAGIAGLIKTVLALQHKQIPPSLHFETPNPGFDLINSPFYVNAKLSPWTSDITPRRAAASSFGIGGTNAHVILEEAPAVAPTGSSRSWRLLILSARTPTALEQARANLAAYLRAHPEVELADVAYTLQVGRRAMAERLALVCRDAADALQALDPLDPQRVFSGAPGPHERPIVFLFPGGGAQYVHMARDLYQEEYTFRACIDHCAELLEPRLQLDLRTALYPSAEHAQQAVRQLRQTALGLPALFVVEYALAQVWLEWGVRPSAMLGHSLGEYVAACLAGVITLEDALALVALRGRLMQELPAGAMLSVALPEAELQRFIGPRLSLAAVNAPAMCVLSGPADAIDELEGILTQEGVQYRRLAIDVGAHSALVTRIVERFTDFVATLRLQAPNIPYISNVTGTWITAAEATNPAYWGRHLRETVRFGAGVATLLEKPERVLLEVGPGRTLSALVKLQAEAAPSQVVLASLRHPYDRVSDAAFVLNTLGQLWLAGALVDWRGFSAHERRLRLRLPTYPFERTRYWIDRPADLHRLQSSSPTLWKKADDAAWFYAPIWKEAPLAKSAMLGAAQGRTGRWLVFTHTQGIGAVLADRLKQLGQHVIRVWPGASYRQLDDDSYSIALARPTDYQELLASVFSRTNPPDRIIHAWGAMPGDGENRSGWESLLLLGRALAHHDCMPPLHLTVCTYETQDVLGTEDVCPELATILGVAQSISRECPAITCLTLDLPACPPEAKPDGKLIDQIVVELSASSSATVAYRANRRWARVVEAVRLEQGDTSSVNLRPGGVYLFTDGLDSSAQALAEYLAGSLGGKLILVMGEAFPETAAWSGWLAAHAADDGISCAIRRLQALDALGAETLVVRANMAHKGCLAAIMAQSMERFGALHGIIHSVRTISAPALRLLQDEDQDEIARALRSELDSLTDLAAALAGAPPDFVLLYAPLSALVDQPGQLAAASATALATAYARKRNQQAAVPWISVNWEALQPQDDTAVRARGELSGLDFAMTPAEAVNVFRRILSLESVSHVIVSTCDLQARIQQATTTTADKSQADRAPIARVYQARPKLENPYIAPANQVERILADLWRDLLGIDKVGALDNFFELGGHSLLATQLVARIREAFTIDLPLQSFFEAMTVAALAERIAEERQAEQRLQTPPIRPAARDGALPLSFAQQRLWFLDQLEPHSPFYTMPRVVQLDGRLDLASLQRSLDMVAARHEALRTTFALHNGQPIQVIAPPQALPLALIDLQALAAEQRAACGQQLAQAEAQRPFDLACGPLLRVTLLRRSPTDHVLVLNMHHIATDAWSMDILARELTQGYAALVRGQALVLPDLPIQYADYAVWQRMWFKGAALEQQLSYWREQLADLPVLQLPADYARPMIATARGASYPFVFPKRLNEELLRLGRREGVTLFMTLLAAFQVLLARYSGQDDIPLGTSIAGRRQAETEGLIGFFVNTLVLRTDLSGDPTFREALGRARQVAIGAYAHQDLPFEQLVEALQPERDLSRHPLFQVMFAMQNTPLAELQFPNLTVRSMAVEYGAAKFDMTLSIEETEAGLKGMLEYSTDLFESTTIERILRHFQALIQSIVVDAGRRIASLPLLTEAEQQQILLLWNPNQGAYPQDALLHDLFAGQAARSPDAIALICERTRLTYHELNRRANQVAHHLRSLGVGPEVRVGLYMERSVELIVGLLGILKAGSAYVPIDPVYPHERLAFMLADAQAPVLLTQQRLAADLPDQAARVVRLDADWTTIAHASQDHLANGVRPDNLAYVIYTSGSTGKPKGTLISHAQMRRLFSATHAWFGFDDSDAWTMFHSIAFDFSVWEIWGALAYGGRLVMTPYLVSRAPDAFYELVRQERVTVLNQTPSAFRQFIAAERAGDTSLRLVVLGGETLNLSSLQPWFDRHGDQAPQLVNMYGITETTVHVTYRPLVAADLRESTRSVIGTPIPDLQIYLLDPQLQPAPIGVPGELYVGGAGLARGYLNRPDLTAARFVPNPFGTMNNEDRTMKEADSSFIVRRSSFGTRLYKTGDRACFLPGGEFVYLGRIDAQVKLRGFRIELGEIEAALSEHPAVREALVALREDAPGAQRLVAYVVTSNEFSVTSNAGSAPSAASSADFDSSLVTRHSSLTADLRAFLTARLPSYMAPSAFVWLDAFPLTPNGKLNRRALPAPDRIGPASAAPWSPPRTPEEVLLAQIWADVLQLDRISIWDNFFALGGHSLLATQVISRIRAVFQTEAPLRMLFEAPTVAGLAERVLIARQSGSGFHMPPISSVARDGALPLSFAQQRLWFLDQLEPNSPAYNMPIALRLTGALDLAALQQSLNKLVQRHEVLRTSFPSMKGRAVQRIAPPQAARLPLADISAHSATEREALAQRLAATEAQRPFDLARGPLMRATLLRRDPADHTLLFTMHHIVFDGWSLGVLIHEIIALYSAFRSGRSVALPELSIQYADYAVWQSAWLQGEVLERLLAYWRQQLADLPALQLPTDRPRPASPSFRGASQDFRLRQTLHGRLHSLSRAEDTTLFMTLLAAFQVLLARYSQQDDIVVGADVANRTRAELEPLIGFFVNQLALRVDLSGAPSFHTVLQQVRARTLDAYAHQDLPFEHLVKALNPERSRTYSPLFQVKLILQNMPLRDMELPGLTLRPLPAAAPMARFDLVLALAEHADDLSGALIYSADLFDAATITRMLRHFQTLLEGIVAQPDRSIADLALLTAAEQHQLILEWNDTSPEARGQRSEGGSTVADSACFHELFAAQAARTPDAVACVTMNDEDRTMNRVDGSFSVQRSAFSVQLSYSELNARANQLAHYLRGLGVGPEVRVGICMERSPELVIALLGVLKAGGAYVPLDPTYPLERLALMIADARLALLLTQEQAADRLPTHAAQEIVLDGEWDAIAQQPSVNLGSGARGENIAYVIYTSGSTGSPKGVLATHRSLSNIVTDQARRWDVRADSRVLQFASLSFDAAISEIGMALLAGATLCLARQDEQLPGSALARLLRDLHITTVTLPPSALAVAPAKALPALRTLIVAGEACPAELIARWARGRQLFNGYGPTEATIGACCAACRPDGTAPPIGRPFANVQLYLLDGRMQPAPIGVAGELYIGGAGVARGYLGRPDLTAARFVPNLFVQGSGVRGQGSGARGLGSGVWGLGSDSEPRTLTPDPRLYRTGDRARYRPDGNLEFLGRLDDQVKLRGYRIELGEVEATLRQHSAVQACVVVVRTDRPGEARLIGYVVPVEDERRTTNEMASVETPDIASLRRDPSIVDRRSSMVNDLRSFLKMRLPAYMAPATFVLLDALPLTPTGKLDRAALPAPDGDRPASEASFVAPRTPIEELLATIWAGVLSIERVGIHDNFFALGGHSLLATQIISRVHDIFDIELSVGSLFEKPTVASLADHLLFDRSGRLAAQMPPIRPAARDTGPLPLSFAQQRLWVLNRLVPDTPLYNIFNAMHLAGPLDVKAIRQSLNAIVRRHEVLRTTFSDVGGQLIQVIASSLTISLPLIDLQDLALASRSATVERLALNLAHEPFDLARGPLLRARIVRVGQQEHVLLVAMHHIVSDGWSVGILIGEIATLYTGFAHGRAALLPPLPIQYADYASWQRQWLDGEALEGSLAYWRGRLADFATLDMPTDRARPAIATLQGKVQQIILPTPLAAALAALSRREGVTIFMTLLAAFQALLQRYSSQDKIAVGSPIANRTQVEVERLIGFFVNTLVLQSDLSGNPTVRELLVRARDVCLGAYAHQDLPFERLVEALQPTRDPSRNPLFQVMFAFQNAPTTALHLPDLIWQPLAIQKRSTPFDLGISLAESDMGLVGTLEYSVDLFDSTTIVRMAGHFETLLNSIVADPRQPIAALSILTNAERQQLLDWNATQAAYPQDVCLHHLFEIQAARTPDAVALIFDGSGVRGQESGFGPEQLTYRELDSRANQLAHHLRQLPGGPHARVVLFMERSPEIVVGLLGILKSGGAYVPLDLTCPAERLAFMLHDTQASALLTQRHLVEGVSEVIAIAGQPTNGRPMTVLCLDSDWATIARAPTESLKDGATVDQLAYLIYTSGTTGQPKAVMVEHRQVVNTLRANQAVYRFGPEDRAPCLSSFSFDIALFECLGPLVAGGASILAPEHRLLDFSAWIGLLSEITFLHGTPGLLRQIVHFTQAIAAGRRYNHLRQIAVGGESVPPKLIRDLQRVFAAARVYVGYGPTEGAILCTNYPVPRESFPAKYMIGRPLQNMQMWIVDPHLHLAPVGVPGELYIGGAGITRGYLGRPGLTAERFTPNPFPQEPAVRSQKSEDGGRTTNDERAPWSRVTRLYRTGDLARYLPDGNIEFLGRTDHQVKIRGYRVELAEIEAVLGRHPAIRENVVVVHEDALGEKRLVAYVAPMNPDAQRAPGTTNDVERDPAFVRELRDFLKGKLPEYMIPGAFVPLDVLPLTSHGKVDRRRLPSPDAGQLDHEAPFVAPDTLIEKRLTDIWADLLGIERIGIHDNFFDLGGHSLLATQLVSHLYQAFQVELPLRSVFETATIAALAEIVEERLLERLATLSEEDAGMLI